MKQITLHLDSSFSGEPKERVKSDIRRILAELTERGGLCAGSMAYLELSDSVNIPFGGGKGDHNAEFSYWLLTGDVCVMNIAFGLIVSAARLVKDDTPNMKIDIQYDAGDPIVYLSMIPPRQPGRPRKKALPRKEE